MLSYYYENTPHGYLLTLPVTGSQVLYGIYLYLPSTIYFIQTWPSCLNKPVILCFQPFLATPPFGDDLNGPTKRLVIPFSAVTVNMPSALIYCVPYLLVFHFPIVLNLEDVADVLDDPFNFSF